MRDQQFSTKLATRINIPQLKSEDGEAVCHWLCKFFMEVRKSDGLKYCPRSILHSSHGHKIHTGDEFKPLHTLLDNLYRELHAKGIGASRCQATLITDEAKMWETSVLGSDTPVSLVFFYNGINFTLRGGEEHRSLSLSQIKFGQEDDMYGTPNATKINAI